MTVPISSSSSVSPLARMQASLAAAKSAEQAASKSPEQPSNPALGGTKLADDGSASTWPRQATSADGRRYEVDRRVEESRAVKVTVVSYSDGSSESLTQFKADELIARITDQLASSVDSAFEKPTVNAAIGAKGMLVDGRA